jgi:hypothetical protein
MRLLLPLFLIGCPAEVQHAPAPIKQSVAAPTPEVDEEDPRVVKQGEDLYAEKTVEKRQDAEPSGPAKGSGKPDESNGYCRLYAPKLPEPHCCRAEYGFDAEVVAQACGADIYMGESLHLSCGYFFHRTAGSESWFRMSFTEHATPKEAADAQVERLTVRQKLQGLKTEPVPGVKGAYWTRHDGLLWAYLPGWSKVRQLATRDDFCESDALAKVIAGLVAAKEPDPKDQRLGLVPKARS